MMPLPPWRTVASPRRDIENGSFVEGTFAANLGMAARDMGLEDYRDPVGFLEKTYLTSGLEGLLVQLARRLGKDPSAKAVHRMQTGFGGGKSHILLTAFHLFHNRDKVAATPLVSELAERLDGQPIPKATVVVLDGEALHPGTPEDLGGGVQAHTLLGLFAHQLGGSAAYATVADQDRRRLGTSSLQLARLLERYSPCLILIDEALEYLGKAALVEDIGEDLVTGTLTFIKELCAAVANTPGAAVILTLTSSHLETYSRESGEELQARLMNVVLRYESTITPIEGDEVFPVLQRRLFTTPGSTENRLAVANDYLHYYRGLEGIDSTYQQDSYKERIVKAYPFHPALVDILMNRWDAMPDFQRTRGVLRVLAHAVHALCQRQDNGTLILPGDIDLAHEGVQNEALRVLGPSFRAALSADIITPQSQARLVDREWSPSGDTRVGVGLATTAFLHSPGPPGMERARGASREDLLIGVGRPGVTPAVIESVRDLLESRLWYLRLESGRYRFETTANLNRIALLRESAVLPQEIMALLREHLRQVVPSMPFLAVENWVEESRHLPDSPKLTLGVLDLRQQVDKEPDVEILSTVEGILKHHGPAFRACQNTALLVVADTSGLTRTSSTARSLLALRALRDDRSPSRPELSEEQMDQLRRRLADREAQLPQQLILALRHLFLLGAEAAVQHFDLGPRPGQSVSHRVLEALRNAEKLAEQLAGSTLISDKFGLLPQGTDALELDQLLRYFAQLTHLPRLTSPEVLRDALVDGVNRELFGLVSGASWEDEDAVIRFGPPMDPSEITFQPGTFLVRKGAVDELLAARQPATSQPAPPTPAPPVPQPGAAGRQPTSPGQPPDVTSERPPATIPELTLTLSDIPGNRMRELVRVAVLPLVQTSVGVQVDLVVRAEGGLGGIPRETLTLTVQEGLRQLHLLRNATTDPPNLLEE